MSKDNNNNDSTKKPENKTEQLDKILNAYKRKAEELMALHPEYDANTILNATHQLKLLGELNTEDNFPTTGPFEFALHNDKLLCKGNDTLN